MAEVSMVNDPADVASINQLRTDFAAAFSSGDMTKLRSLYSQDAFAMENGQPSQDGLEAIIAAQTAMRGMASAVSIELTPQKTHVVGDMAYDRGTFRVSVTPNGAPQMTEEGRYLVVLLKQADGSWKLAEEIGNSPTPPTAVPMPAAGRGGE
jgi:uncharacterized protein (TIGR02246 family)